MATTEPAQPHPPSTPHPALWRLDRLVGTWEIRGRTPESQDDNISGRVTIEWLPGGFFLQQRGEMQFQGMQVHSLEVVGYDPATAAFPSYVFSNMDGVAARYGWDVQGDTVTHWTDGSKYTGFFSADGNTLTGAWRPEEGREGPDNIAYEATMLRVTGE